MLFSQFLADFRLKTGTDEYTFPASDVVTLFNGIVEEFALLASDPTIGEDHFGKVFQHNLSAGVRRYDFPVDLMRIKRVDILIDGELVDTREKDMNTMRITTITPEAKIQEIMKTYTKPVYEIFGNAIFLYTKDAIVDTTLGLNIHGVQYPSMINVDDFTTNDRDMSTPLTVDSQGLPRPTHGVLLMRCVINYKDSRDKPLPLTQQEQNYVGKLKDVIKALKVFNLDRRYKMSDPNDSYRKQNPYSPLN